MNDKWIILQKMRNNDLINDIGEACFTCYDGPRILYLE